MACRLDGAKPLSDPILSIAPLGTYLGEILLLNRNLFIFIQENAFEMGGHFVSASIC